MDIENVHKNTKLLVNGMPYNIDDAEFVKPGKGRAIYRLKLKNLMDSSTLDITYHSGDKVEEAHISNVEMQYLYRDGDHYVFMNTETFEQQFLDGKTIGDKRAFLKEGMMVTMMMLGDKPISVSLPYFVELQIVKSAVTTRTDTFTSQLKTAVLETGATIGVPTFVKEGDIIKVDTRTGTYVERVGTKK